MEAPTPSQCVMHYHTWIPIATRRCHECYFCLQDRYLRRCRLRLGPVLFEKMFPTSHVSEIIGATLTSNRHWNEILFYFPLTLPSLAAGHQGVVPCLHLRGILADESQDLADALLTRIEEGKRQLDEDARTAPDGPDAAMSEDEAEEVVADEFVPDYEAPPDVDEDARPDSHEKAQMDAVATTPQRQPTPPPGDNARPDSHEKAQMDAVATTSQRQPTPPPGDDVLKPPWNLLQEHVITKSSLKRAGASPAAARNRETRYHPDSAAGDGPNTKHAQEWHDKKRITMKDIPRPFAYGEKISPRFTFHRLSKCGRCMPTLSMSASRPSSSSWTCPASTRTTAMSPTSSNRPSGMP